MQDLNLKEKLLTVLFLLVSFSSFSQTLIINEVSNGPSGNMEYIELVVVDSNATYDCTQLTNPPCIDVRGWIIDDNSGYHAPGVGVAAGCNRFSFDQFWECVPVGTIILIYNSTDPNSSLPPDDLSMTDGNCSAVVPINNTLLFESNVTTPGAIACSYPATGWTAGGNWSTTLLANTGDCARIVDLNGCEVFSFCYAAASQNTLIYFNSGGSGQDNVWFFNNGDPNLQTNWTEGCADPGACGFNNQTPGLPNNAANQNYINQFNNGCISITPLSVSTSSVNNTCVCDGTAIATASGSIPGYSYIWYDQLFNPIGQTGSNASGLCSGTYNVICTSAIGCLDTASVTLVSMGNPPVVNVTNDGPVCEGQTINLSADTISGATYSWTGPDGFTSTLQNPQIPATNVSDSGIYTVTVTSGTCSGSDTTFVMINPLPLANAGPDVSICAGTNTALNGSGGGTYSWNNAGTLSNSLIANPIATPDSTITYTLTVTLSGCTATDDVMVTIVTNLIATITPVGPFCANSDSVALTAASPGGIWSGTGITDANAGTFDPLVAGQGTFTITYTIPGQCGDTDTTSIMINNNPFANAGPDIILGCNSTVIPLDGSNSSLGTGITYLWTTVNGNIVNGSDTILPMINSPGDYVLIVSENGCIASDTVTVSSTSSNPVAEFNITPVSGFAPLAININNTSSGNGLVFLWNLGNGNTSSQFEPIFVYDSAGIYNIILIVTDLNGCTDTAVLSIEVFEEYELFIPNVFSTNGDGINDNFHVIAKGVESIDIKIYNRWGQLVHQLTDINGFWDGRKEGKECPSGTYFYIAFIVKKTEEVINYNGTITLLR